MDLHVQALDSPLWHRVAPLAPRLRATVRVRYRHGGTHTRALLVDKLNGRHHLVDPAAWAVIGLFDGQRSLAQIWQVLTSRGARRAPILHTPGGANALTPAAEASIPLPTQQEVIDCLIALDSAGLLLCDQAPDISAVIQGQDRAERARRRAAAHPLSWKLPLQDPSAWLARLTGWGRALFHPITALLWVLLLAGAALQAGMDAPALQADIAQRMAQPHFLALAWGVYPLLKGLHELGHALAVQHFGGEVRHVGVAFLYLIPAPYVDASAAAGFGRRRERMGVSAVGMAIELALAAFGLLLWARLEPGALRDLALAFAVVGGVSTVIANANPLVRMDGYHLLTDALDLPNLATRSRRHGLGLLQRLLLGHRDAADAGPLRRRERLLLPLYAPLSWAFGAVAGLSMAVWLADRAPLAGAVVGALSVWSLLLRPAVHALRWLIGGTAGDPQRRRAFAVTAAAGVAGVALLSVPLPHHSTAFGTVWVPESATVRAPADGFVRTVSAGHGAAVAAGQPLLAIVDDTLPLALAQARSRRLEQDTLAYALQWRDPPRAQRAAIESAQLGADEAALQARLDRLQPGAASAGTVHWLAPANLPGRWVRRGEVLGHVLADDPLVVRVAVPAERWPALQAGVRRVQVRGAAVDAPALTAAWSGRAEAPAHRLPAAALGSAAGGAIDTDPADADGLRTLAPVVVLDVQVPGEPARWLGQRMAVQFEHAPGALAPRLWRALQQTVLQHLGGAQATEGRE